MKRKILSLFSVVVLLFTCFAFPVNAASNQTLRYQYIGRITAGLEITGNDARCEGSILITVNYPSTITVELQQLKSSGWTTIASESEDFTGTGTKPLGYNKTVDSGYTYRVVTTATIYSDSSRDTIIEEESGESPTDFA